MSIDPPREEISLTEEELAAWGESVGAAAPTPLVLALRGDLGAGKTTLARAIARGFGVGGPIPSPTYNFLFRYPVGAERALVHIDLYRLEEEDEVWALGWSELPHESELVLIEWPERAEHLLPTPRWDVQLSEDDDPDRRIVNLKSVGDPPPVPDISRSETAR